jgi:hypothetical protein
LVPIARGHVAEFDAWFFGHGKVGEYKNSRSAREGEIIVGYLLTPRGRGEG